MARSEIVGEYQELCQDDATIRHSSEGCCHAEEEEEKSKRKEEREGNEN